jgi:hypothetical protein
MKKTRGAPSAEGLALVYLTVQRAVAILLGELGRLLLPVLGNAPRLDRSLLLLREATNANFA